MKAELVFHEKRYFPNGSFQEIKIWKIPKNKDAPHGFKYSFVYIVNGERIIGYDNAERKGDHKHHRAEKNIMSLKVLIRLGKALCGI